MLNKILIILGLHACPFLNKNDIENNGSVNSKRAHLVSPCGGEFVRKPLPFGGAFVNSSRSG